MGNEIDEIYQKVDSLFKLKLKPQINNAELNFERFLSAEDLVYGGSHFILVINKMSIHFKDLNELYSGLKKIIDIKMAEIKTEIDYYENHKQSDMSYDETFVDYELEELSDREYRLWKVKEKIEKNRLKNNLCTSPPL